MTEQEQKAFTAMREALKQVEQQWAESGWGFRESIRTTVQQALTAANAVSAKSRSRKQNFNLTPTQLQMIGAGEMDDPRDQRPQATEPACKTCKHFTQGKNPLVGTYEMQCFECCNYYASKWEERDAHHE